ncbi:MAG TPA: HlyU family transcriptional regulator [Candidatus Sulfotelmatobacter sp.]|nr:HlyU family transcriptional regulator [Candidatus Sulfotelmatobacter sp.]
MFSKLKAALGLGGGGAASAEVSAEAVEYKGYRIKPAPYRANNQFQTAGVIEKDFPDGVKQHRFIRAETHPSADDAVAFAVTKGKQIVDQQGDRMFE